MPEDEFTLLQAAAQGLLYPSETDAPFDVFRWKPTGTDAAKDVLAHATKLRGIEEIPVAAFFDELDESDDAPRFRALRKVMESSLSGLKVYRIGSIEVEVFVIGKARSGDWVGLHTISVET